MSGGNPDLWLARILAAHATGNVRSRDVVEWALSRLEAGATETGIAILAGLDPEAPFRDIAEWFHQALLELGIEVPEPREAVESYLRAAAGAVLEGADASRLLAFARENYYDAGRLGVRIDFINLMLLDEAIEAQRAGDPDWEYLYGEFDPKDPAPAIRAECEAILRPPEPGPREGSVHPYPSRIDRARDFASLVSSPGDTKTAWVLRIAGVTLLSTLLAWCQHR